MELFMIKPVSKAEGEEGKKEVVAVGGTTERQNETPPSSEGEASLEPPNPNGETPIKKEEEEKPVLVALQGPLSKIYTDVLNKVLSTETYVSQLVVSEAERSVMASQSEKMTGISDINSEIVAGGTDKDSFGRVLNVFCFNDLSDMDDVVKLNDIVTKSKTQDFILAMESCSNDAVMRSLLRMEKDGLVKISMSKNGTAHEVARKVLTKKPGI